jgi:hypothetical protein
MMVRDIGGRRVTAELPLFHAGIFHAAQLTDHRVKTDSPIYESPQDWRASFTHCR